MTDGDSGNKRFKRVYLHIGLGKTGSTAIQRHLLHHVGELAQSGYLYPHRFCPESVHFAGNHSTFLDAMVESASKQQGPLQVSLAQSVLEHTTPQGLAQAFAVEFENSTAEYLILSAEGVGHFPRRKLLALLDWLGAWADEVRVIACIRHPESALASEIQQRLKVGRTLKDLYQKPPLYNFQVLLGTIAERIGVESMQLYDFEEARLHPGGAVSAFVDQLRLELPAPRNGSEAVNVSMSLQAVLMLDILNQQYPPLPDGRRDPRWDEIDLRYFIELPGDRYYAPKRVMRRLVRLARPQLRWLEATFGMRLSPGEGGRQPPPGQGWWFLRQQKKQAPRLLEEHLQIRPDAGAQD